MFIFWLYDSYFERQNSPINYAKLIIGTVDNSGGMKRVENFDITYVE